MNAQDTIPDVVASIQRGENAALGFAEDALARIESWNSTGPGLHALIAIADDLEAQVSERDASPVRGALHGVPVVLKDNIQTTFAPTTAGSVLLDGYRPRHNAPIVDRLRSAGAIIIGKANLHEFSFGLSTESSKGGSTRNPFDVTRNPGGSSGGTAVAVAVGFAVAGVGTDTGGSVRFPAAHTSLCGLRPTAGALDSSGIVPISHLMDTPGPIARTVGDLAILFDVMLGMAHPRNLAARDPDSIRLGILRDRFGDGEDELPTTSALEAALTTLGDYGVQLVEVDGRGFDERAADTVQFEFAATMDRYLQAATPRTGIRDAWQIANDPRVEARARARMMQALRGADDSRGLARATRHREIVRYRVEQMLNEKRLDALIYPTFRTPAAPLGEDRWEAGNGLLASVAGLPAVSVPAAWADNLPIGMDLLGRRHADRQLLATAATIEWVLDARRVPEFVQASS
ncbi:amidase [Microbacterium kribbense]|uniref:Amidase n=1 Tax=Microbacterium kribbense TaxID=433645 RepID=A0ABP7GS11_9MICO